MDPSAPAATAGWIKLEELDRPKRFLLRLWTKSNQESRLKESPGGAGSRGQPRRFISCWREADLFVRVRTKGTIRAYGTFIVGVRYNNRLRRLKRVGRAPACINRDCSMNALSSFERTLRSEDASSRLTRVRNWHALRADDHSRLALEDEKRESKKTPPHLRLSRPTCVPN